MTIYATYFDNNFLVRGLACLESLVTRSAAPVRILVLALDDACADSVARLWPAIGRGAQIEVLTLAELEANHPVLSAAAADRSRIEYYFTLTPFLCAEALLRAGEGEQAVYIDADLFFYSDPEAVVRTTADAAVAVVEHRFPRSISHLADLYGRFNVGWLGFKPSRDARDCLARWQAQCVDWCKDHPADGRYADQKYLDAWPAEVRSLAVIDHPGVNLAPWNLRRHRVTRGTEGDVRIDGAELVFFHFHRLQRLGFSLYETDLGDYGALDDAICSDIYEPYLRALDRIETLASRAASWRPAARPARFAAPRVWWKAIASWPRRPLRFFLRRRVIFRGGRALTPWRSLRYA